MLADDFPSVVHVPINELDPEEVNLLYVAVTRAVEVLEINTTLRDVLGQMVNPKGFDLNRSGG